MNHTTAVDGAEPLAKLLERVAEHRDPKMLGALARELQRADVRLGREHDAWLARLDEPTGGIFEDVLRAADRLVEDEARSDWHAHQYLAEAGITAESLAPALPVLVPLADFASSRPPPPVIWRDDPGVNALNPAVPVLSEGTVSLFSSMGGLGKTTLVLALALESARGGGATCGLRTTGGPVVIVSYEDGPPTLYARASQIAGGPVPDELMIWPSPEPLWVTADLRSGTAEPGPGWSRLWEAVERVHPAFVVLDPLTAAAAYNQNDAALARAFMAALADRAQAADTSVLIVAHDTKAARSDPFNSDPAGSVAGSGTYHDAARAVLHLRRPVGTKTNPGNPRERDLACVKSNFGPSRWEIRLCEAYRGHRFIGFQALDSGGQS